MADVFVFIILEFIEPTFNETCEKIIKMCTIWFGFEIKVVPLSLNIQYGLAKCTRLSIVCNANFRVPYDLKKGKSS